MEDPLAGVGADFVTEDDVLARRGRSEQRARSEACYPVRVLGRRGVSRYCAQIRAMERNAVPRCGQVSSRPPSTTQLGTGDVTAGVGGEKHERRGQLLGSAEPAHDESVLQERVRGSVGHLRGEEAGQQRVHPNTLAPGPLSRKGRVRPRTAALDVEYAVDGASSVVCPRTLDTLTMEDPAGITGAAACAST